jgi:hypothetical protein
MPSLIIDSEPSGESSYEGSPRPSRNSVLEDDYRASYFPGYAEKPLEEQLEPVAVIGMGESNPRNPSMQIWEAHYTLTSIIRLPFTRRCWITS